MTSERLYEFWVLSKTLNYNKAAEQLFLNPSLLSKHVAAMEKELNTQLFLRNSHKVTLTEAGQMLARQAEGIISRCDQAERFMRQSSGVSGGKLHIACSIELSYASHIRLFMQRFMSRYPDTELSFEVLPGSIPEEVLSRYDLVFSPCAYYHLPPEVTATFILSHGTYIYLPPGHPMVSRSMISLSQLGDETLIVPHAGELFGPYAKNAQLAERYAKGKVTLMPVSNLSTALFLVSCGQGILIGPRYVRNMILSDPQTITVNILDKACRFDEYLYRCNTDNEMAGIFEKELKEEYQSVRR
ncbi:MAG: LysR family transcriptional regulator [Clostridia bacterium]|nr:LysR family transcriptional regulator [Clostridia bacterium]